MKIGVVDTMFARANMGKIAIQQLEKTASERKLEVELKRVTVPGIKDLAVASKILFDEQCDIVLALGFVGEAEVDERCAMEAGIGLIMAELAAGKHILKVFIHSTESLEDEKKLHEILLDRVQKHSVNALDMLFDPDSLIERAGSGQRQGGENAGSLKE